MSSKQRSTKNSSSSLGRFLVFVGVLILVLVVAWLGLKLYRVYTAYQAMAPHLDNLQTLVSTGRSDPTEIDLAGLEDDLRETAAGLEIIFNELRPFMPLARYMGWVPAHGGDIQAAPYLLGAAWDLSEAGVILLERFSPLLGHELQDGQTAAAQGAPAHESALSRAVTTLVQAQADLDRAGLLLQQAQASLEKVDSQRLSPQVERRVAPLQTYLPLATSGLGLAKRLPGLLGAETPQTYLILTQNMDEIRPTGGYINAAGHIVLDHGQIVEFEMGDSYAVDRLSIIELEAGEGDAVDQSLDAYPYPPDPIRQYMAADYWVLRDANWSPDFPTSAHTALELYELGRDISADGVIALDQQAVAYLMRAFEPLEVDGEIVTSENAIQLMRQSWAIDPDLEFSEWWLQRKSFMVALSEAVRHRLEHETGSVDFPVLVDALQQALAEKHMLIYLEDPVAAEFLTEQNWAGSLHPVVGDYLMVVDANLGFNKASALVERQVAYDVTLSEDGSAGVQARLVYAHPAAKRAEDCWHEPRYDPVYEQNMERCYWDYVRLVVPAGAELISGPGIVVDGRYLLRGEPSSGEIDVEPVDPDKVSWGQLFLLAPGERLALDYTYTLPPGTARRVGDEWRYSLYLQKQPGTLRPPLAVTVTLPEGAELVESQLQPEGQPGQVNKYVIGLSTDQEIDVSYRLP